MIVLRKNGMGREDQFPRYFCRSIEDLISYSYTRLSHRGLSDAPDETG